MSSTTGSPNFDPARAAAAIVAQFPELAPAHVTYLGEGYDSTAFDVNRQWVFRFPKAEDVERQLEIESRILPALGRWLPVAVPNFCFHGQPTASFGRRFCGYPKIPGIPAIRRAPSAVPWDAVARTLAGCLSALHTFPVAEAARAGVPEQSLDDVIEEVRTDALDDLAAVREVSPDSPIDAWRGFLEQRPARANSLRLAVVHNDFGAEHVLFDPSANSVTGIIDWSDVAISDPAADFAGLFHWGGEPFARAVLEAYDESQASGGVDEIALARARYMGACRGAMDVRFGVDMGRPEYVASGIRALHLCAR